MSDSTADDKTPTGFAQIPRWVQQDETISWQAKLVYLALSSRADKYGQSHPSHRLLAAESSSSIPTVKRALDELRALGLVSWEKRFHEATEGQTSNVYTIQIGATPSSQRATPSSERATPQLTQTEGVAHTELPRNETQKNETQKNEEEILSDFELDTPATADDPFDELWAIYPRHEGKAPARVAFAKTLKLKKITADELLQAARDYRDNPNRNPDPGYLPHLSTWLNQERWTDEIPAPVIPIDRHRAPTAIEHNLSLVDQIRQERNGRLGNGDTPHRGIGSGPDQTQP